MMSPHYQTLNSHSNLDDTEEGPLNAKANMNDYSFINNSNLNGNIETQMFN